MQWTVGTTHLRCSCSCPRTSGARTPFQRNVAPSASRISPSGVGLTGRGEHPPSPVSTYEGIPVTPTRRPSVFSSSGRPVRHTPPGLRPPPPHLRCSCSGPMARRTPPQGAGAVHGDRRWFGEPELEHRRCEAGGKPFTVCDISDNSRAGTQCLTSSV